MSQQPLIPHDRQLVDYIIKIWRADPKTENLGIKRLAELVQKDQPGWPNAGEDRIRALLKQFGLTPPVDEVLYTFVENIKSEITPDLTLPENVDLVMTEDKGKCLHAKKYMKKGQIIFAEKALFAIPSTEEWKYMKSKLICSYCTKVSILDKQKVSCKDCEQIWCSSECEKLDKFHKLTHNSATFGLDGKFNCTAYAELEKFCTSEDWTGLRAVAIIQANILLDEPNNTRSRQFKAMAGIEQEARHKASTIGLFAEEQRETLLSNGYTMFSKVFPASTITHQQFSYMLGTYNLNNLSNKVFLIYSHLNHNCKPNISHEVKNGLVTVVAARDINAGEELSTTYVNPELGVHARQNELRVNWGFICNCRRCKTDLKHNK